MVRRVLSSHSRSRLSAALSARSDCGARQGNLGAVLRVIIHQAVEHGERDGAAGVASGHGLLPIPQRLRGVEAADAFEQFLPLRLRRSEASGSTS